MPGIQRENLCKGSAISVKTNLEFWKTDSERELDVFAYTDQEFVIDFVIQMLWAYP